MSGILLHKSLDLFPWEKRSLILYGVQARIELRELIKFWWVSDWLIGQVVL